MRVVCISDTHGDHELLVVPDGDVLLHAGDLTAHGTEADLARFLDWFSNQPHRHRIFVAGNHDAFMELQPERSMAMCREAGVCYLNDSGTVVQGVRFWGSPITPRFLDWWFMRDPGEDIDRHWRLIPDDTDVLITHGPPLGILDVIQRSETVADHTGCEYLLNHVQRIQPRYHLFGHIHEGFGRLEQNGTTYLNISSMNKDYRISNQPIVLELEAGTP